MPASLLGCAAIWALALPAHAAGVPANPESLNAAAAVVVAAAEERTTSLYWGMYPGINRRRLEQGVGSQEPQGETIKEIRVEGNSALDDETVTFFMALRAGGTFDWITAQQDFRTLLNSDFFDDLSMSWVREEDGIVVILEVAERPILREVRIEGTEKGDVAKLIERMELIETPITLDQPINRQLMMRAADVLTSMLQGDEGLQFVQVQYLERPSEGGSGIDVVYDVVEGDTVRIENVYFEGATQFTQKELRWLAKKTSEHWLFSFLVKNDRYSPAGFEFDSFSIGNEYRRIGYLDIEIGQPEIDVYEVNQPWPLGDTRRLFLRIPINEGPQYRLGKVVFEGNTRFTDEQLGSLVPMLPGDLVDVKGVVDAQKALENIYSNVGYFQVTVGPIPEADPATATADIRYLITENALYTVRRIEFEGNTNTRDYVMRRNLQIGEKDLWSQGAVEASKFKIQQLGYFDNIEEEVTIVSEPGAPGLAAGEIFDPSQFEAGDVVTTGEVDLTLRVSEVGRNQISFGGGVSALEGAFVQFGYATRNLFGRGQTFSFNGQFGGRTTSARVSFTQPYVFDKNIRFGFDVFRSNLDFIDFQQKSSGISTRFGFPLGRAQFMTLFLEYNYTFIDIGDLSDSFFGLSDPIFNSLFLSQGQRTTSSIRPNLIYNRINNPFNPSTGRRHTASFEFAGGPLGGTLDFWKGIFTTTWYMPTKVEGRGVGQSVSQLFAFHVDARVVEPFGDAFTVIPIFERFFLGGSNSVRGTQIRSISPVDQFGNLIGGTRAIQYNIEYIFQLANPVRVAVFHDAGAAWDDTFSLPLSDLRKTAGVEFRVFMPVFNVPFRFFWAYNFDPLAQFGEERSSFEFAIGTTF